MRPFEYATPSDVDQAVSILAQPASAGRGSTTFRPLAGVQALAGGTDVLPLVKADIAAPTKLVDLRQTAGLTDRIEETPHGLSLGALTTLADLETSALVRERFPLLAEAAALAATPQLRNVATLGGNLLQRPRCWYFRHRLVHCWLKGGDECQARDGENQQHAIFDHSPCVAVHPSDPPVVLVALDSRVTLHGPRGERTVALTDFFAPPTDERRTEWTLANDELVVAVHVPALPDGARSTYHKAMDRKVWAFALVSVAAAAQVRDGRIAWTRLALGGVANTPLRLPAVEQLLVGQAPDDALFDQAAEAALQGAQPLEKNAYKLPLTRALIRRALREVTTSPTAAQVA